MNTWGFSFEKIKFLTLINKLLKIYCKNIKKD
jgi:hypothetical protein